MKLTLGYFYPQELNLYGDNGNVEILCSRARARNIDTDVLEIGPGTKLALDAIKKINLAFMGGGPDSGQKSMYEDLLKVKGPFLKDYIESGGVGLFVCGSYQLLGHYYKSADGNILNGLGVFDLYTESFGRDAPRCIGNVVCEVCPELKNDVIFKSVNKIGTTLVGFENHGGRTYLGKKMSPLAKVFAGSGNNGEDKTEGVLYKNSIGTYLHGPVLSKNPHLADYLLAKGLGLDKLSDLDDSITVSAHTAAKKLWR